MKKLIVLMMLFSSTAFARAGIGFTLPGYEYSIVSDGDSTIEVGSLTIPEVLFSFSFGNWDNEISIPFIFMMEKSFEIEGGAYGIIYHLDYCYSNYFTGFGFNNFGAFSHEGKGYVSFYAPLRNGIKVNDKNFSIKAFIYIGPQAFVSTEGSGAGGFGIGIGSSILTY